MYDVRDFLKDHSDLIEKENFVDLLACCPKNIEWRAYQYTCRCRSIH